MLIEQDSSTQFRTFCLQTHLHADFESLYKEVPKRLLPEEYGGEAGPMDVLIGECGVLFLHTQIFCLKRRKLSLDTNLELTKARPTFYVAYFDIET
jgi:hypothetical protein